MSRLIVKNLPKTMTEGKLSQEFAKQGQVTDCQLKYTPDGVFRKFAFVGFTTEREAEAARDYFHGTFLGTAKIHVEICRPLGDAEKPRAWSKYAKDSSAFARLNPETEEAPAPAENKASKKAKKPSSDPKWAEFLSVQGKTEEPAAEDEDDPVLKLKRQAAASGAAQGLVIKGLPKKVKVGSLKEFLAPVRLKSGFVEPDGAAAVALLTFNRPGDLKRVLKRNGEHFGGFKLDITSIDFEVKKEESANEDNQEYQDQSQSEGQTEAAVNLVSETGRIFVKNLSYFVTEEDLEEYFKTFGEIAEVVIPIDLKTQRSKGYGIVTFVFPEHAVRAFTELDGSILQGRMLHLLPGKEKPGDDKKAAVAGSSFKAAQAATKAASASSAHNWNALFVGAASVGSAMSAELGVSKAELLSAEGSSSLGVRMALGETRLVAQTREFLLSNGVAIDEFARAEGKRSAHVILAKNLPAGSTTEELRVVFGKFGELGRVVLPPSGVSALVEFLEPGPAKAAFKAVAYSRFKTKPFFLEWAPEKVFSGEIVPDTEETDAENPATATDPEGSESQAQGGDDEPPEPGTTIFVKNLNFETQDDDLQRKFGKIGPLASASVATKANPKAPSSRLSMGFGFVQFRRTVDAQRAIKELQGGLLHNHAMELRVSTREAGEAAAPERQLKAPKTRAQGDCTKILVRNIPFQAKENELRELFSAFGDLRFVRMPRKVGRSEHRGFGFVDFSQKGEAKRAFEALGHSTHLYGRRLVLEWSVEEETLDEVRKRTNSHFTTGESRARKGKEKRRLLESLEGKAA